MCIFKNSPSYAPWKWGVGPSSKIQEKDLGTQAGGKDSWTRWDREGGGGLCPLRLPIFNISPICIIHNVSGPGRRHVLYQPSRDRRGSQGRTRLSSSTPSRSIKVEERGKTNMLQIKISK